MCSRTHASADCKRATGTSFAYLDLKRRAVFGCKPKANFSQSKKSPRALFMTTMPAQPARAARDAPTGPGTSMARVRVEKTAS